MVGHRLYESTMFVLKALRFYYFALPIDLVNPEPFNVLADPGCSNLILGYT